jgi:hypothetical protein
MGEPQMSRVQKISAERSIFLNEILVVPFAINIIADNRMSKSTQMNPDLMRSTGMDFHFK